MERALRGQFYGMHAILTQAVQCDALNSILKSRKAPWVWLEILRPHCFQSYGKILVRWEVHYRHPIPSGAPNQ
jgi:hypothetical protein